MEEYPKIRSIFKRDERTHKFIVGMFSLPEFAYLAMNDWQWTEKIDGTNIRVFWEPPDKITFGGRTDNAQIPPLLLKRLQELFPQIILAEMFPQTSVCFYGEGYGVKIQKAGRNYIPNAVDFALFDVLIGNWWLQRDDIEDIASKLGLHIVPIVLYGDIQTAIECVQDGLKSTYGDFIAEGLVGKPLCELHSRDGNRIVTKLKGKDF